MLKLFAPFVLFASLLVSNGQACPFCPNVQSLSDEMASMEAAVIARLVKTYPVRGDDDLARAQFEITAVLKGEKSVKIGDKFDQIYFGEGKPGSFFLLMGTLEAPKIIWGNPLLVTARAKDYLARLGQLPKDGNDRLKFFWTYLEDEDNLLAHDAYDEFAKASYAQIREYKPHLNHNQLVKWISDPNLPASRRRLYLVMLGVCGSEQDLPMLVASMKSTDRKQKAGLDALVACYITLAGEPGLALVEELFLKNRKADYSDTYAVIMALRFHATEGGVLSKPRVTAALKHMLKRPELADLIIPDLAAAEDWSAADELFELFKSSDDKSTWVRVPVVNYLRKCPTERAKDLLKECERIDPAAVKKANTFFPAPEPSKTSATRFHPRRAVRG
jgi:hypothetical protein